MPAFAERNAAAVEQRNKALGGIDPQYFARACLALAEIIPGAGYREIAASGHCPMLEQPDTLVRFMQEFLEGRDG